MNVVIITFFCCSSLHQWEESPGDIRYESQNIWQGSQASSGAGWIDSENEPDVEEALHRWNTFLYNFYPYSALAHTITENMIG